MFNNYRYYTNGRKVIAVSTYAGRRVKGVAVCSKDDEFNLEQGKKLAAARCGAKIAEKRHKRAIRKFNEALAAKMQATRFYDKMQRYYFDATDAYCTAKEHVQHVLDEM